MSANKNSKFEKTFAAAAFAEAGEHETAIRMGEVSDKPKKFLDKILNGWQNHMAAIAFAEANEHEEALRWVENGKAQRKRKDTLAGFLENVGLENARVCFGVVPIES